mmetsp:Transcript_30722/g.72540  ORF Transcript_30722/g.72540 Transcript_30722/m.72540 type:complete len:273 (+) Transcript_30722:425-1243(+)
MVRDRGGDLARHLPDVGCRGEDSPGIKLLSLGHFGEGHRRTVQHRVGHCLRGAHARTEADAGEDVHVVALGGRESLAAVRHGVEGRSRGDDGAAIRPTVRLGRRDLAGGGWVGEGEDDGPLMRRCHRAYRRLRYGAAPARQAEDELRLLLLDGGGDVHAIGQVGMVARVDHHLLGLALTPLAHEAVLVEEHEVGGGRLVAARDTRLHHSRVQRLRHTDARRASAHHRDLELGDRLGRAALHPQRAEDPGQHRRPRALDVIVEAEVRVAVLAQ